MIFFRISEGLSEMNLGNYVRIAIESAFLRIADSDKNTFEKKFLTTTNDFYSLLILNIVLLQEKLSFFGTRQSIRFL